jgi:uncharacterized protein (TIGR02996 family)
VTHEEAILQDVLEHPSDDTPRLVYADWLEENDQPERAEFIRLQVELARRPEEDPGVPALRYRAEELLAGPGRGWDPGVRRLLLRYEYRRGFLEVARVRARTFLRQGAELFRATPVREVALEDAEGLLAALAASPVLAWVEGLSLSGRELAPKEARALAQSPHLKRLTRLELLRAEYDPQDNRQGPALAEALAESPWLAQLEALALPSSGLGAPGARALAQTRYPPRLTSLDLSGNSIGAEGLRALAGAGVLDSLSTLRLAGNALRDEGARALAEGPALANCTHLDLARNGIGDAGALALASCAHLARLTSLSLKDNSIRNPGVQALAASPHLANLRHLDLVYNCFTGEGAEALADSPHLARLSRLLLNNNGIASPFMELLRRRFGEGVSL